MSARLVAGFDIGGTKCAVSLGSVGEDRIDIAEKIAFATPPTPQEALETFGATLDELLERHGDSPLSSIGISCGGPLDSKQGLILSPPNLPGWDRVDVVGTFRRKFGVPVRLQNDANACAYAEWKWGAGVGTDNMIFLTFGTGMGAGLILNGRLYSGTNDYAGEVGHVRLEHDGPEGYGKKGSFEGFCSGGGIARLAQAMAVDAIRLGQPPAWCGSESGLEAITAREVGLAAQAGEPLALAVYAEVGRQLGRGLAMLVDILNPELIVIGSIFGRQRELLEPIVLETLKQEALPGALGVCRIVPAGLGERVGDYASLALALLDDGKKG